MSQAPSTPAVPPPAAPAAARQGVVDYDVAPAPRRAAWLNVRVILFVLVFGAIIGVPIYSLIDHAVNHGIKQRADGYLDVDLKTISLFPLDQQNGKTEDISERFRALDGKKVVLVGEMWVPNASGPTVDSFELCYSVAKCCFSGPPQAQHFVKSTPSQPGTPIPVFGGLVRVKGTMSVGVIRDAEKVQSVYRMTVDEIEPI